MFLHLGHLAVDHRQLAFLRQELLLEHGQPLRVLCLEALRDLHRLLVSYTASEPFASPHCFELGHLDQDIVPQAQLLFGRAQGAMEALREGLTSLRDNIAAPDSAIQQSTRTTLEQLERAAFSLRGLADYIQRHPESLLRGRAPGRQPKPSR